MYDKKADFELAFLLWRFYFGFVFSDGKFEFGYIKNCLGYFYVIFGIFSMTIHLHFSSVISH
ncbi:hypothetical protein B0682_02770 [Moraxella lincolnii]|uniref:Uncharacterized protein n=1 Tax=Lwoffella lincolnii TaxID=90241 RepID=A0A1T0CGZ3_9GAMM|nr:hypothetical protein B0682_02770 [Moraxella lincolnii]